MSELEVEVEVDAPPARVWEVVSDPANLPRWDRRIASVEGLPAEGLSEGDEYTTQLRFMGAHGRVRAHVLELRPPEYARVRLAGLVDAVVETWVKPLDGRRSSLRHRVRYRFPGGPLGELASRAVGVLGGHYLLRHGAEAQKRQAEGR